jgi:hypothetical protein
MTVVAFVSTWVEERVKTLVEERVKMWVEARVKVPNYFSKSARVP